MRPLTPSLSPANRGEGARPALPPRCSAPHAGDFRCGRTGSMTRFRSAVVALCVGACLAAGEAGGYRLVRDFFHPPPDLKLGAVSGVATDAADNLYVLHRGDPARPLLVFDK